MHVLIVGAGGFLGRHIAGRLIADGITVTAAGRAPERLERLLPGAAAVACDLARDEAADWAPRLAGIDAVVNCAGVFGAGGARYQAVHVTGARALFAACREAGVRRVIQVSALGADARATTLYHRSKRAADDALADLCGDAAGMDWVVLRPSLVIGRGGRSTRLFTGLAAAALPIGLARGCWRLQPIHVDNVTDLVSRLLHRDSRIAARLDVVGPQPMTTDDLIRTMVAWLGRQPRPIVHLPEWVVAAVAGARLGPGTATPESLAMLRAGNVADAAPLVAATGFRPRSLAAALGATPAAPADRMEARLFLIRPVLRLLLAMVWLAGGLVPLLLAPLQVSLDLLARVGIRGAWAPAAFIGAALLDLAIGLLAGRRAAARTALLVALAYSAFLAVAWPALLADPFGPVVKNLAVIGLALALLATEADHD